ncbi:hypothetical protein E3U44_03555 [Nitrosococcus wardiae]|uniref:NirD/YgiW/YdeI family stress tolerance protein n=2 Tax=Nitrosococcus wardiae TaxID=1814290 RepID=A0A4V1AWF3_9GAMM|nr:hypothetical protein E3U44_03555 [Nitrosococcus wardiae]
MMATALLMTFSVITSAQAAGQQAGGEPQTLENVEELLDDVLRYDGKKVRVSGEVEELIDQHSFILESGGLFNDEMVVLIPEGNMKAHARVTEDSKVTVTGTVRAVGLVEVEREYGWDLDPHLKVELENVEAFLISDNIEQKEED